MSIIRNCVWGYKCKASWEILFLTSNESIRFCSDCQKEVYRCETQSQLSEAIVLNHCVNFPESLIDELHPHNKDNNQTEQRITGIPMPIVNKLIQRKSNDDKEEVPF